MRDSDPPSVGRTWQRLQEALGETYILERELTGGGMSQVFVAHDVALERRVVVKVLPEDLAASVSRERFRREVMLSAALQHPHIVGVFAVGEADGHPYFIMPFVDGEALRARLSREGRLSIPETVRILRDVARALAFAHGRGVVHRDIKPDNVLLAQGAAMVADFGVAKAISAAREPMTRGDASTLTMVGTSLGTPAYMAPEQAAGDPATDHRADIYAFGVMAYEMLAGQLPFVKGSMAETLRAHLTEDPLPLAQRRASVPQALHDLVMQSLEKDPTARPRSADDLVASLEDPSMVSGALVSAARLSAETISVRTERRKWMVGAGIAAVMLSLAGVLLSRRSDERARSAAPAAVAPVAARSAIAVLPFASISADSNDVYLADGMTDELTNALSRVKGLRVASRRAADMAHEREGTIEALATELGVSHLLEGTVQRQGERLRVTVRLVTGTDGFTVWSDVYEYTMKDIFDVQHDIAQTIVGAISPDLGVAVAIDPASAEGSNGTANAEAYESYLRGRFLFSRRGETALRQALAEFGDAVKRDSGFARAWAGLAQTYAVLPLYSSKSTSAEGARALAAAERAIVLDSTLSDGYAARGALRNASWAWAEGAADLRRAAALDSTNAQAFLWLGENRLANGAVAEALQAYRRAATLDPVSPVVTASYALALAVAGQKDSALARGKAAVALDPSQMVTHLLLGSVHLYLGEGREAQRELEIARSISGDGPVILGALGVALAMNGDREGAQALLARLDRLPARQKAGSAAAKIRTALGDTNGAILSMQKAVLEHDPFFGGESLAAPIFDALRSSPGFADVVRAARLDVGALTRKGAGSR